MQHPRNPRVSAPAFLPNYKIHLRLFYPILIFRRSVSLLSSSSSKFVRSAFFFLKMSEGSVETKTKVDSAGELSDVDNENCSSSGSGGGGSSGETRRTCVDCGTFRTPLWRGGPAGPKSLCNACGIKSRKKRQAASGMKSEEKKKPRKSSSSNDLSLDSQNAKNKVNKEDDPKTCSSKSSCTSGSSKGVGKFLDLGFKVPVMKRSAVEKKRLWRKLGEEERAAVLLMALSCGSVYA